MIIHPDGRLEGTPEELAAYQKTLIGALSNTEKQTTIKQPIFVTDPQPSTAPKWPLPWVEQSKDWKYQGVDIISNN